MKHKIIYFLFFGASIALFTSCRKPGHSIRMYGIVYDEHTGVRIPNANVYFDIYFSDHFSGSSMNRTGGIGTTDANGTYEIFFEDADRKKEVDKRYDGSVVSTVGANTFSIGPDYADQFYKDFPINGHGKINIVLTNTNPFDTQDLITNFYCTSPGDLQNGNMQYSGMNVNDTLQIHLLTGERIFHSSVTKNNVTVLRSDTVYVETLTDTYYQLNY